LNGFSQREVKKINFLPSDKADPSDDMGPAAVALDEEYLIPHTPMGVDAEEGLVDSDKNHEMQDRFRRQLLEVNAIGKQETTEKFVGFKGQPTVQEGREHDSKSRGRKSAEISPSSSVYFRHAW
jgi:hypothetical protein